MRAARACFCAAALALVSALAAPAGAASPADRDAARTLAGKGYELFEVGDYPHAILFFRQAEARFHAPPHGLYVARAQVKLKLYLEAKATYEGVLAEKLAADAPAPFKEAQTAARGELAEVVALTPSLTIEIAEPAPPGARVTFDGNPVPASELGQSLPRNPGNHTVIGEAPGLPTIERTVLLKSGGADARVLLPLTPPPARSVVPAVIALAVGAVGIGAGTTAAILLRSASPGQTTALRATEIGGFAVGAVGVGAGIVLFALRPARAPKAQPASVSAPTSRLEVRLGLGSLGVRGAF